MFLLEINNLIFKEWSKMISYKYNDERDCTWLNAYSEWLDDSVENNMSDDNLIEKYGQDTHDFFATVTDED